MKNSLIYVVIFAFMVLWWSPVYASQKECIVVLHGLWSNKYFFKPLEKFLKSAGYDVYIIGYPSVTKNIQTISTKYVGKEIEQCLRKYDRVHFVTHSLGGIVLRYYLQDKKIANVGRIVMVGHPNKGSGLVDRFKEESESLCGIIAGPAAQQIGTDKKALVWTLKPLPYEIGIIAGDNPGNPWFSSAIPGADDGRVSVESARLEEMKDFIVVHHQHTFILNHRDVRKQILNFIRQGQFMRTTD
ncbi:MAG: hypothetical protein OS130_04795 [Thermodesulfobacteriota bacterium]|nr:MAG: hypothetical protein OS130_04795 [Thermodesulfobacteriota bacterium]